MNSTTRAMVMMIGAMLALPGIDAIAKWLAGSISSGQVTMSRFLFQVLLMLPLLIRIREPWQVSDLWLHASRGFFIAMATLLFFTGLAWLPIADAIAIFFIEPMLVTLLSMVFLGESVGWRRISAIAIGFIGAMVIIRPTFAEVGWPALFPVGAAACFAFYIILTRKMAPGENPVRLQFLGGLFALLVMVIALLIGAAEDIPVLESVWPTPFQWFLLATLGVIGAGCHLLVVYAYGLAPVSILAPFQYVEIIGATILGLVVFGDFPDLLTWFGVSIIVGSGIYIFHRESKLGHNSGVANEGAP